MATILTFWCWGYVYSFRTCSFYTLPGQVTVAKKFVKAKIKSDYAFLVKAKDSCNTTATATVSVQTQNMVSELYRHTTFLFKITFQLKKTQVLICAFIAFFSVRHELSFSQITFPKKPHLFHAFPFVRVSCCLLGNKNIFDLKQHPVF